MNYWVEILVCLRALAVNCCKLKFEILPSAIRYSFFFFWLAHFAARFCELLGRDTRCVCEHLQ